MKALKIFVTLSLIFFSASYAAAEKYGLGVVLGDPTGVSGKMKLNDAHSVDAALAYSSGRHSGLQFHSDYLWDRARSWDTDEGPLHMYYGLGGRLISYEDKDKKSQVSIGPRGSLGVTFNINNPNLEFFGEGAVVVEVAPSINVDLDAGIGARIRF